MELRIKTFVSSGRWLIVASFSATIFLCGIWLGVGANLGPFSRRDHLATIRGFLDRLTTQLLLSTRFGDGLNSLCRLPSFLACLASIFLRTAWALLFKKCFSAIRLSAEICVQNSCESAPIVMFSRPLTEGKILHQKGLRTLYTSIFHSEAT